MVLFPSAGPVLTALCRSYAATARPSMSIPEAGLAWAVVNKVLRGGVSALGCLLAAVVVVVAIPAPHAAEPVTISYRGALPQLARLAPYPAVSHVSLPPHCARSLLELAPEPVALGPAALESAAVRCSGTWASAGGAT